MIFTIIMPNFILGLHNDKEPSLISDRIALKHFLSSGVK